MVSAVNGVCLVFHKKRANESKEASDENGHTVKAVGNRGSGENTVKKL